MPATARDAVVSGSAKFRSRQRLPILTYLHPNAGCIVRCAQPMAGANNRSDMVRNFYYSGGIGQNLTSGGFLKNYYFLKIKIQKSFFYSF